MRMLSALTVGSLSLLALAACENGTPANHTGTIVARLEAAPLDPDHAFSVGICIGPLSDGDAGPTGTCAAGISTSCTGTLIAPNLVLTARHCVEFPTVNAPLSLCTDHTQNLFEAANLAAMSDVRVTVDPSVRLGSPRWHTVAAIALPAGTAACDDDIALLRLDDNVAATDATPIAADIYTDLAVDNPGHVAVVGRGAITEVWDVDSGALATFDRGDYSRRLLTNIAVVCVSDTDGTCSLLDTTLLMPPNTFDLTSGVFTIAGPSFHLGDSGSGVLDQARFDAGNPTVIGVGSYEGVDATGHGSTSFAVRLTQHHDFIATTAMAAATAGGYTLPSWVSSAPVVDGGSEAGADASADAGSDAGADAGTDAGSDAAMGADAAVDAGGEDVVTETDAGGDDVVAETDAGGGTDAATPQDAAHRADAATEDGGAGLIAGGGACACSLTPTRSSTRPAPDLAGAFAALALVAARRRRR